MTSRRWPLDYSPRETDKELGYNRRTLDDFYERSGMPPSVHDEPNIRVGETIRMEHYQTAGGGKGRYRVWQVVGVHLGATYQESTVNLKTVDYAENHIINVPVVMIDKMMKAGMIERL